MPEGQSASERRRHPRVVANLSVRSRPLERAEIGALLNNLGESEPDLPALGLKKGQSGSFSMAATNLSVGGISATGDLQVLQDQPLPKGTDLLVEMDLGDAQEPLRAIAQVMWTVPNSENKYLAGLMFVVIGEASLERIKKFVSALIEQGKIVP